MCTFLNLDAFPKKFLGPLSNFKKCGFIMKYPAVQYNGTSAEILFDMENQTSQSTIELLEDFEKEKINREEKEISQHNEINNSVLENKTAFHSVKGILKTSVYIEDYLPRCKETSADILSKLPKVTSASAISPPHLPLKANAHHLHDGKTISCTTLTSGSLCSFNQNAIVSGHAGVSNDATSVLKSVAYYQTPIVSSQICSNNISHNTNKVEVSKHVRIKRNDKHVIETLKEGNIVIEIKNKDSTAKKNSTTINDYTSTKPYKKVVTSSCSDADFDCLILNGKDTLAKLTDSPVVDLSTSTSLTTKSFLGDKRIICVLFPPIYENEQLVGANPQQYVVVVIT